MNSKVDAYIERSEKWPAELGELRAVLLRCGLDEQLKWGKPCYMNNGANIAIAQEMKDFLALMFFKGALLSDPDNILEQQGPNSRAARRICFRSVDDVTRLATTIEAFVSEAIDVEAAGLELPAAPAVVFAEELQQRLDSDDDFRAAFEGLTPGRQREYNLFISDAKQAKTRAARVEKHLERILAGKGLRDR